MAKRRMISQSIWTNRRFIRLNCTDRMLFIGLVTIADDEGRLWNDGLSIKAKIFPVDNIKVKEIQTSLEKMAEFGLIEMDNTGIQLTGWENHQKVRNDMFISSVVPEPLHGRNESVTVPSLNLTKHNITNITKNSCSIKKSNESNFNRFWNQYDKKINRGKCEKRWNKLKSSEKTEIFNTLNAYIESTPNEQYRKNPLTYLNNEGWKDVIIERKSKVRRRMEETMGMELPA